MVMTFEICSIKISFTVNNTWRTLNITHHKQVIQIGFVIVLLLLRLMC